MMSNSVGRKSILFVHLQGGFGNQLFIYFAAKYFEEKFNKRIYFISGNKSKLFRAGIKSFKNEIILPKVVSRFLIIFLAKLSKFINMKKYIYFSKNTGYENIEKEIKSVLFISGYFQSYYYIENTISAQAIKKELVLELKSYQSLFEPIDFTKSIAFHIRRGDYNLPKNNFFGMLSIKYYQSALSEINRLGTFENIYLFSDSKISTDFKNALEVKYRLKIIDTSAFEKLDDLATFALLTQFNTFVISNSTFSWWAGYLGNHSKKIVAPSKWFKSQTDPGMLYPNHWLIAESYWEN